MVSLRILFFFNDIRTILQKEFTPKHEPLASNRALYDIIKKSNSVCVHIRRGNFLSDEFRKDFMFAMRSIIKRQ